MEQPVVPVPKVVAMRFFEDRSNFDEFIAFCGGGVREQAGGDDGPVAELADGRTLIHPGDYALKLEDGTIRKMYDCQYEELFTPIV